MRFALIAAAALSLAACTTMPADGEVAPVGPMPDTCRAEPGQRYVGSRVSADVGAQIVAATNARELRWIPPDTMVTMEYKFGRVTVAYDGGYRITRVSCG